MSTEFRKDMCYIQALQCHWWFRARPRVLTHCETGQVGEPLSPSAWGCKITQMVIMAKSRHRAEDEVNIHTSELGTIVSSFYT